MNLIARYVIKENFHTINGYNGYRYRIKIAKIGKRLKAIIKYAVSMQKKGYTVKYLSTRNDFKGLFYGVEIYD